MNFIARYITCINNFNAFRNNLKNLNLLKRDLDYFKKYVNDQKLIPSPEIKWIEQYGLPENKNTEYYLKQKRHKINWEKDTKSFIKQKNYFCTYIIDMKNIPSSIPTPETWIQKVKYNHVWRKVIDRLYKATNG